MKDPLRTIARSRAIEGLLRKVLRGELTPGAAEAEALQLGLGKLSTAPNPSRFDPMKEIRWTMPMAVAWIAWRSADEVRGLWDAYRRKCWDWRFREWRDGPGGPIRAGHFLERRIPATLTLLSSRERHYQKSSLIPARTISVQDAKHQLWKALEEDAMQATGIDIKTEQRVAIANHLWRDLEDIEEGGKVILRPRNRLLDKMVGYEDVVVRREAVTATWPPHRVAPTNGDPATLMRPDGAGYMPLYCAAQWIATRGGVIEIEACDSSVWQNAFDELLARIASEQVATTGLNNREREKVPGHIFAGIGVDLPFSESPLNFLLSEELYLYSCIYIDHEHWQKGLNDRLESRYGCKWSKLMVLKSDVARHWPFSIGEQASAPPPSWQTGAPGRPTSMHLVEAEYRARWGRGEAEVSIGAEAEKLAEWLHNKHPDVPQVKPKTIANRLRSEHRKRIANAQN